MLLTIQLFPHVPLLLFNRKKTAEGFQPVCCTIFKLVLPKDSRLLVFWPLMYPSWMPALLTKVILSTTSFHDWMD